MAIDMPDEYPVAVFNETNIKQGSLHITGIKESEVISGVDVTYIEPTNHYKRESVRVDTSDANDGVEKKYCNGRHKFLRFKRGNSKESSLKFWTLSDCLIKI